MRLRGLVRGWRPAGMVGALRMGTAATLAVMLATPAAGADPPDAISVAEERLLHRGVPDIPLQFADGRRAPMSSLWQDMPLLVTFFYRRCHGVCTPFLAWVRDAVDEVGGLGSDYRILALSFDEADTVADVSAQASALGVGENPDWLFAVTARDDIARITGALDFWYRQQPTTGQYDHNALLVAIDDGRVMRALLAGPGSAERFRDLAWELRGQFIPYYKVPNQSPWRCFSFDPATGRIHLDWGLLILLSPALTTVILTFGVFRRRA